MDKTVTLRELAYRKSIELARLNASSNLTPEDFLARTSFDSSGQTVLDVKPFARSFEKGNRVMRDGMNLEEESTLKVVVDALEHGKIVLCGRSWAPTPPRVLKKHPIFRLSATRNPRHAGKRERMSFAFFSRFLPQCTSKSCRRTSGSGLCSRHCTATLALPRRISFVPWPEG